MKKSLLTWAATCAVVAGMALPVMAAGGGFGGGGAGGAGGAGGGRGGGRGGAGGAGGGGRGAVDPATQLANIKTAFGSITDPEWNALSPKIQAVLEAQQKVAAAAPGRGFGGGGGGGGGRGGRGGGGGAPGAAPGGAAPGGAAPAAGGGAPVDQTNPLAVAKGELNSAVATGATTADADIKTKLTKFRDERKKANDALDAARKALQPLVTIRQEAILVNMGILE